MEELKIEILSVVKKYMCVRGMEV